MVYKFKATIDEDKDFMMIIEIKDNQTFYEFHQFIQEELEYDKSYLASFYIASHSWKPILEIPQIIIDPDSQQKVVTMEKAVLKDYIKDAHQKLLYLFDNIYNRSLKLELIETKPENPDFYYPICTDFKGEIPPQIGPAKNESDEEENLNILHSSRNIYYPEIAVNDIEDDINIPDTDNLSMPDVPEDFILEEDIVTTSKELPDNDIINDKESETIITSFTEEDFDDEIFEEFIIKNKENKSLKKQLAKTEKLKTKEKAQKKSTTKKTKEKATSTKEEKSSIKLKSQEKKETKKIKLKATSPKATKETTGSKVKDKTTTEKSTKKSSEKQKISTKKEIKNIHPNKTQSKNVKQKIKETKSKEKQNTKIANQKKKKKKK